MGRNSTAVAEELTVVFRFARRASIARRLHVTRQAARKILKSLIVTVESENCPPITRHIPGIVTLNHPLLGVGTENR